MKKLLTVVLVALTTLSFSQTRFDSRLDNQSRSCEERLLPNYKAPKDMTPQTQSVGYTPNVSIYWEVDSAMNAYLTNQGINTTNYINSLFAKVQAIYYHDSIRISLAGLKIWTTDSYKGHQGYPPLIEFADSMISLHPANADVAMLLSHSHRTSGGVAFVQALCYAGGGGNTGWGGRVGVCDYLDGDGNCTSYCWDVYVCAHEMGHLLGANHTHDCVWTINGVPDQPIDGCGPQAGYNGGSNNGGNCPAGPYPPISSPINGKGTIMSYCDLNIGVEFADCFGSIVAPVIRDFVGSKASCLVNPNGGAQPNCVVITTRSTSNITNSSATLNWNGTATSYSVKYWPTLQSTKIKTVTTTSHSLTLTGLLAATGYSWKVRTVCSPDTATSWDATLTFTTVNSPVYCQAPYGISITNIASTSAQVNWTPNVSADSFQVKYFLYPTGNSKYKYVRNDNKASITGLLPSTTYQARVKGICNGGTTAYSSAINFTTPSHTYLTQNQDLKFSIYPNPSDGNFTIQYPISLKDKQVMVFDILGNKILNFIINDDVKEYRIVGDKLPAGMYLVQINDENVSIVIQ